MKQSNPTTSHKPISRGATWLTLLLCLVLPLQPALAGKIIYYHNDASGSPVMASNAEGEVIWREHYTPYGKKLNNPANEDIGYTGHEYDAETGLTYMQARYYDAEVGRFLAIDPVGFKPNQPMTFNRYSYANNNPYKYHDPDGRIIDTIADVGFIVYDIYKIATEGATATNTAALVADIGGALIPGATGLGLAVRGANKGADAVRTVDNAVDTAKGADGVKPANLSPFGAGRSGAFNEAKRQSGIPTSQQPSRILSNADKRGNPQPGKIYEYEVSAPGGGTSTVRIRDDAAGHNYGPGNKQNRDPHFNDEAGKHYDY